MSDKFIIVPKGYERFYPRHWRLPSGYFNPARLAQFALGRDEAILDIQMRGKTGHDITQDQTFVISIVASEMLARFKVPTLFCKPELCESLAKTELPESLRLTQVKWAMPCFLFVLNQEFSMRRFGTNVILLATAIVQEGDVFRVTLPNSNKVIHQTSVTDPNKPIKENFLCWFMLDNGVHYSFRTPTSENLSINALLHTSPLHCHCSLCHTEKEPGDDELVERVTKLALNMLFYMSTVPNDTAPNQCIQPGLTIGKHEHKQILRPALFAPRWLGEHYRVQRYHQGDTHASPEIHWRIGHWRHQPHGPQHSLRKLTWIEPVLVNKPHDQ